MKIAPIQIEHSGPGIDLSNLPDGISVTMADTAKDFRYSRNMVTLTVDLADYERVHLLFKAREYGDEPHAPPPNPFGNDVDFDGVAISEDGAAWYEIQDLRHLTTRLQEIEVDLDAAIAACGLSYNSAFKIRFCQFDNGPIAWDGIALSNIRLTGKFSGLLIHLAMNDNADDPIVHDSTGQYDQTLLDPGGDPNTNAHSVPGAVGSALAFDGIDDGIDMGPAFFNDAMAAGNDFTVALWAKFGTEPFPAGPHWFLSKTKYSGAIGFHFYVTEANNRLTVSMWFSDASHFQQNFNNSNDGLWHHYALMRQGKTIMLYKDGSLVKTQTADIQDENISNNRNFYIGRGPSSYSKVAIDDFQLYDRALTQEYIATLYNEGQ